MKQSDINILDLPNEILLIILNKLDNIDVLYSLFGINNKRLDILLEDDVFTNTLNLVTTSSITDLKLDRFCIYILPRIDHCIKKFIIEGTSIERILLAGDYKNLTCLELFNFEQDKLFRYFTDNSVFRHIFQHRITDLILHNNDQYISKMRLDIYTRNVYGHILAIFKNLKHFTIISSSFHEYPHLSISYLPATVYFSSTLTVLCINVFHFEDCLYLLDGRLKQLSTLIVEIRYIFNLKLIHHNKCDLHNLKCFSLTSYYVTLDYDESVVPLLRRMTHLEKLTLYVRTRSRSAFVDGTHLQNEILLHMPQLHSFIFYISSENLTFDLVHRKSYDDIQQTFTNIKYGQTSCIIDNFNGGFKAICHIYSLPFIFTRLEKITTHFPTIVFDTVTHLSAYDVISMKHEFFMRISRAFPMLKHFSLENERSQTWEGGKWKLDQNSSYSIIKYPNIISLDIMHVDIDYVVQFLLETKTYLPNLTELKVNYYQLKSATMNFTRDATRSNCSKVKRLIVEVPRVFSKDVYQYFPSL
ncbi:unnamed protein product [Rotaria sp. Silwood2]|nr:unnamed protein product [Rotaria sp. Silwood2]CAF4465950.1 unnamed protein product [Rotaria sp. Silwood2]